MIPRLISLVTLLAGLGSGLIGGVFFAFSSFVLPALVRLPGLQGIAAMQSINVVVLNRSFLGSFLGTALACAVLVVDALARWSAPGAKLRLAASLFYLVGTLFVTGALNVPLNNALARMDPRAHDAARGWARFVAGWSLWNHVRTTASIVAAALFALAMTGCSRYWECSPASTELLGKLPERLSQTGLYRSGAGGALAEGVRAFAPQFELWSDGAQKRRWVSLPPGERIDTSDVDNWAFPVGTTFWKEFAVPGERVETRLLRKVGPGSQDWAAQAYVWLADGSDAVATPAGASDARGTAHDVPSADVCPACHGGRKSFALGFSALQLAYDAGPERVDLNRLRSEGLLTHPPSASLELPGDETDRAALGYLHANCGHCHNQDRPQVAGARCYDPQNELDFWLRAANMRTVSDTPTYRSAHSTAIEPGRPDESRMVELMSERGFLRQMPPLGTEVVDRAGSALVRRWIAKLD